ncbi:hypothetical protein [Frondihabitans australicus]|uniref:Uncharacterized protein n=1 Tax=Frondihabitans australicus TaxID=386892 RepID=A0A495ILE0_9MICO|nr:hypothetical protein [Frondihabitans australicus]RKR76091.1 hypothetical protein C8E83_3256 [Frondihabitans australicus]
MSATTPIVTGVAAPDDGVRPGGDNARAYRRILRRETHSSRSRATITVLVALIVVAAWTGLESVYAALGMKAILYSPVDVLSTLAAAARHQGALVIAVGIACAIVGVILIVIALAAGRRGRHTIDDPRLAVVVDDHVAAAVLARKTRVAAGLAPGQVNAWVARRSARVTLTPSTGTTVDRERVLDATREHLLETPYLPPITVDVRVTDSGRLGA